MGMFGDLMGKIFRAGAKAEAPQDAAIGGKAPESRVTQRMREQGTLPPAQTGGGAASTAVAAVDIAATLDKMAASNKEKLDWKHSIVDLMKLVGMDSSLSARKELADDLKYTGDKNDSAKMNMWLHKTVLARIAENGGNVPKELLD